MLRSEVKLVSILLVYLAIFFFNVEIKKITFIQLKMAEKVRFEPTKEFTLNTLSKRAP